MSKSYHSSVLNQKKKKMKKMKENNMNFEDAYLSDGWVDSTQIWIRSCPTMTEFPQQKRLIFFQALLSYSVGHHNFPIMRSVI